MAVIGSINSSLLPTLESTFAQMDHIDQSLATGSILTSPAVNPSDQAMTTELSGQLGQTTQGLANLTTAQGWLNTAGGALQSAMSIAQQMEALAIQASASDLSSQDSSDLQRQMNALVSQLTAISTNAQYNQQPIFYNPVLTPSAATVPQNGTFTTPLPSDDAPIPLVYWSQLPNFASSAFQNIPLTGDGALDPQYFRFPGSYFWLPYSQNNAGFGTFLTQNTFVVTATTTLSVSADADDGVLMYVDQTPVAFGSVDEWEPGNIVAAGLPMPPESNTITVAPGLHTVTLEAYNIGGPAGIAFHVTNDATGQALLGNGSIAGWRSTEYFTTPPAGSYNTPGSRTILGLGLGKEISGTPFGTPDTSLTTWHVNVTNQAVATSPAEPSSITLPALPKLDALNSGTVYSVSDTAEAQTTQTFIRALQQQISAEQTQVGTTSDAVSNQMAALTQSATNDQNSLQTLSGVNLAQATTQLSRDQVLAQTGLQVVVTARGIGQAMSQWLEQQHT